MSTVNVIYKKYSELLIPKTFDQYCNWISADLDQPLNYLRDQEHRHYKELRRELKNFYSDCLSTITYTFSFSKFHYLLENYYNNQNLRKNNLKLASFILAFEGEDYHFYLERFLKSEILKLEEEFNFSKDSLKIFLDKYPVLERDLAHRSGIGFIGKNSMLIDRKEGSFFLIGGILLPRKLSLEEKEKLDLINSISPLLKNETTSCGNCRRCIDLCPTNAIHDDSSPFAKTIEVKKCLSFQTIEKKSDDTSMEYIKKRNLNNNWIAGCDICQNVCPWNNKIFKKFKSELPSDETIFSFLKYPKFTLIFNFFFDRTIELIIEDLRKMSNRQFLKIFYGTSLYRIGRERILENISFYERSGLF